MIQGGKLRKLSCYDESEKILAEAMKSKNISELKMPRYYTNYFIIEDLLKKNPRPAGAPTMKIVVIFITYFKSIKIKINYYLLI